MANAYVDKCRHLVLVLGDQLDANSSAFDGFEADTDALLMLEVDEEASYVPQHKLRLVLFFSAMRHFCAAMRERGRVVHYSALDDPRNRGSLAEELARWAHKARPERVIVCKPGDYRVEAALRAVARDEEIPLEIREDRHFLCGSDAFAAFAEGRSTLVMETFYRRMRREHDVLMDHGEPVGGKWNFDTDNRGTLGADEAGDIKAPRSFRADTITDEVIALVERRFPEAPGHTARFDYPVTRSQARAALRDFVEHRLGNFGDFQDAMLAGRPYLYHSRLSTALNLHLLTPREVLDEVLAAHAAGAAPLNAVEGFVRQVLGWREYVRGIYWLKMPDYADMNTLGHELPMPAFMWNAQSDMACVHDAVTQLVEHAYAHHIQRLMVLGLFAMLLGVKPYAVHEWHLSMYADAVDWVSLPNVLGMSQYADGGIVGSKPYAASANYVNRMSNYCAGCRYDPRRSVGDDACPFNTLYWDFLSRHRQRLAGNHRMAFQLRNLDRKDNAERRRIRVQADSLKSSMS